LVYDVSIDKVLENENEKILNLIALRIPEVPKEKFDLKKHQSDLTIEVPEEAFYLSGLQVAKKAVTSDLQKFFPNIDTVAFQEIFKRSEPKPELPTPSAKPAKVSPEKEEKAEAEPEPALKKAKSPAKKKEVAPRKPSTSTSRKRAKMGSENQR
jgi:outer membrane biosynthesis protein TonB